jgi:hypothetical protein
MKSRITKKSVKADIKAILDLFLSAEVERDNKPEVYCETTDSYITNPRIEQLYARADAAVNASATAYRLERSDIVSMTWDDNALNLFTHGMA